MDFLQAKHLYAWLHKIEPGKSVELIQNFLREDMVKYFIIFSNKKASSLYIMHNCFIDSKLKCRCVKLNANLIAISKQRVNCNYFGYNSINQYLWLLGKILSHKNMVLIDGYLNDVLIATINKSLIKENYVVNNFYEKKLRAISDNDFTKEYYDLTVHCPEPSKKENDDMLLGCAQNGIIYSKFVMEIFSISTNRFK